VRFISEKIRESKVVKVFFFFFALLHKCDFFIMGFQ
jgi:hypothetical protein